MLRYQVDASVSDAQHQELIQEADHHQLFARSKRNALFDPQHSSPAPLQSSGKTVTFDQGQSEKDETENEQKGCAHLERSQPQPRFRTN